MNLKPGDRIRAVSRFKRKVIRKEYTVVENDLRKNFMVVNTGIYNETIDRFQVKSGKLKIELVKEM